MLEAGQERLFDNFRVADQVPPNHLLGKLDALLDLDMRPQAARAILQRDRPPVGRSGADDPDVADRLLLLDPFQLPADVEHYATGLRKAGFE